MAIADITKPMALDETLQATNTALGNVNTNIQAIGTAVGGVAKDTTLQATNTAIGNTNTAIGTQNSKLDTMNTKLQAIVDALGSQSLIGDTDISGIADGTITGAIAEFDSDITDLDTDKADKVDSATNGNLAGLNGSGNLTDSGWNGAKDTTSISGNPISISGLKANQLASNPIITLEPIQAGSGTPSPSNIRAISGYDKVEALSGGVNLLDKTKAVANERYNATGTVSYTGSSRSVPIRIKPSTTYYFKNVYGTSQMQPIWWLDASQKYISYTNVGAGTTASGTATSPANAYYVGVNFPSTNIDTVLVSEGQAIDYVPYVKTTSISESLGQTVYGGTHNVRSGLCTDIWTKIDASTLSWGYNGTQKRYEADLPNAKSVGSGRSDKIVCSKYATDVDAAAGDSWKVFQSGRTVFVYDASQSGTPSGDIAYILANTTIQLTPHEISLLSNYAYVSTNGTTIALDYHNGELASLADVSQLGETVNELGDYVTSTSLLNGLIHSKEITVTTNASGLANINMDSRKVCIINMFIKSNTTVHYIALVDIYQINSYIVKALNGADLTPVANQSITIVVYYYDLA